MGAVGGPCNPNASSGGGRRRREGVGWVQVEAEVGLDAVVVVGDDLYLLPPPPRGLGDDVGRSLEAPARDLDAAAPDEVLPGPLLPAAPLHDLDAAGKDVGRRVAIEEQQ